MAEGARALVGTHDFRSFGSEMSKKEKTTRTILAFDIGGAPPAVDFLVFCSAGSRTGELVPRVPTLIVSPEAPPPTAEPGRPVRRVRITGSPFLAELGLPDIVGRWLGAGHAFESADADGR